MEQEFIRGVPWSRIKYLVIDKTMNPIKVRVTKELAALAGIKPCCFMPACAPQGVFACGARSRAMADIRLPSRA